MKKISFLLCTLVALFAATSSYANSCNQAVPICTASGYQFQAVATSVSAEPGNSYYCLTTQPDPQWFYLEIGVAGNITLQMQAAADIDFILYGPFANQAAAFTDCGNLGLPASEVVGCSYSISATESVAINGAVVGQYYIGVITNYAAQNQIVTVTQTAGSGGTSCAVLCGNGICNSAQGETFANCPGDCPPPPICNANNGAWN